jgi:TonB-linked SusC/RagA family outer membrane protein
MKLCVLIFFSPFLSAHANERDLQQSQPRPRLSLDLTNVSVEHLLNTIENTCDYLFVYRIKDVDLKQTVSIKVSHQPIETILDQVFAGTRTEYEIVEGQVFLVDRKHEPAAELTRIDVAFPDILPLQVDTIRGTVVGEEGTPLPGVTVRIMGTNTGTITDEDGRFLLTRVDDDAVLAISYVGYLPQEVQVQGRRTISVTLAPDLAMLEEVVVVGYGTQRKSDLTGSVASVSGKTFENVPVSRVDQMLQGRASGVQVTQINGAPGTGSTIRIRGGNSIQADNEPLYVIDGFIVGTDYNLNSINVNDIQSIEILKDASAIAIYGTRGANGVILITTKSGQGMAPGKPHFSLNAYTGVQEYVSEVDLASGPELAYLSNLDAQNRGAALPFQDLDNVPDTDWIGLITEAAPMTNLDFSITGLSSDKAVNYYVSGNYFNQDGIVRNSGIERFNFRTNLDYHFGKKVSMGLRLNISRSTVENPKVSFPQVLGSALTAQRVYNDDGSFTGQNPVTAANTRNPEADIRLRTDHDKVTNILGSIYLQYEPVKDLVIKSTIGPKFNVNKSNIYLPAMLPERLATQLGGEARVGSSQSIDILNENTVTYMTNIGEDHRMDFLAGFTWQTFDLESVNARAYGFTNDAVTFNNLSLGDPVRNEVESSFNGFQLASWLGRVNYNFKEKYLLTMVGRVDGSSRFSGSNNQYAFFPSVAAAWRLSEEPWIKDGGVFDNLKLRMSYGIAGNQAIDTYRTLARLETYSMFFNGTEQYGVRNGRPANPTLTWETTNIFDAGLEAAFLEGRISLELDYYHKETRDLLLDVEIPRQTGFDTKLQNLGSIQNAGLELSLNTINVETSDFSWRTVLTLAGNRSKVLDIGPSPYLDIASPTGQVGPAGRLYVGHPVPVFVGVRYLGVWKSQEDIDASGIQNQQVGGPRFNDTDGDKVISISDYEILGSPEPTFYGGLMNTLQWKNLTLDVYFNASYGNDLFNSRTQRSYFFRDGDNAYKAMLNHWDPVTNPDSDIPMPGTSQDPAYIKNNDTFIEDGSYLRLKNVRLTYSIGGIAEVVPWIKNVNVYLSGTNLALWSGNRLFDPETSQYGTSSTQIGFTSGEYPIARTITIGLNASF